MCEMQRAVYSYEGVVRQFLVDDKGTSCQALVSRQLFNRFSQVAYSLLPLVCLRRRTKTIHCGP